MCTFARALAPVTRSKAAELTLSCCIMQVLEALDSESLVTSTAATNAAIANTSFAMENARSANAKLNSQLQQVRNHLRSSTRQLLTLCHT